MKSYSTHFIPLKVLMVLAIVILVAMILIHQSLNDGALASMEHNLLRATPPPDVAIELSEAELAELTEAYESGFDHPDPERNDDPCERLQLLPFKKLKAWRKQFRKRGFTVAKIKDILKNGRREAFTHPEKGITYTKIYDQQGNWIVVDFVDCLIWQVAPYNFK
jgi:NADH:ubiquinone oxidoreductase subunit 3 (subunit A)